MSQHKMLTDDEVRNVVRSLRERAERWRARFAHMDESFAKNQCEAYSRSLEHMAESLELEAIEIDEWIGGYQKQIEAAERELKKSEDK
jgi:hypothetical protein